MMAEASNYDIYEILEGYNIKTFLFDSGVRMTPAFFNRKVSPMNISLLDAVHDGYSDVELAIIFGMVLQAENTLS